MRAAYLVLLSLLVLTACDKAKGAEEAALGPKVAAPVTSAEGAAPLVIKLEPAVLEAGERELRCVIAPAGAAIRWERNGERAGEGAAIKLKLEAGDRVACVVGEVRAEAWVTRAVRLADTQPAADTLRHARRIAALGDGATLVLGRDDAGLYGLWRLDHASGQLAQVMPLPGGPRLFDVAQVGQRALFLLPVSSQRLAWVSDGAAQGSYPLPLPGAQAPGAAVEGASQQTFIAACGQRALIAAPAEGGQAGLWRTDGTIAGTEQLRALKDGWRWERVACAGDHVLGLARRGRGEHALWDVGAGRELAKVAREEGAPELLMGLLAPVGGAWRWWESDATVTRVMGLGADGQPRALVEWPALEVARLSAYEAGGRGFFVAHPPVLNVLDGPPAGSLWRTDGAAPERVAEIAEPVELVEAGGGLYALGERAIWAVAGEAITQRAAVEDGALRRDSKSLLADGARLVFVVERAGEALLCEAADGGASRCMPGCAADGGVCPEALVARGGEAIWVAESSAPGERQTWRNGLVGVSDAGLKRATLPRTMSGTSPATPARMVGSLLYFGVSGGERGDERQRWVTDGTPAGTRRDDGELPTQEAWDGAAYKVAEGMVRAAEILVPERPAGLPMPILPYGGTRAIALGKRGDEVGLWVTDGGAANTKLVMESRAGEPRVELPLGLIGDTLIFVATDPLGGAEPWAVKIEE